MSMKSIISKLFIKRYKKEELEVFRFFSRVKLFEKLTFKEMEEFLPYLHLRTYNEKEVVFFRNDPSQALYIIKEGVVELSLDIQNRFEPLVYPKKHINIGVNALLANQKRLYNAICQTECELYVIPQVNLLQIFKYKPHIHSKMMTSLAEIYSENTEHLFNTYRENIGFFELGDAYMWAFRDK
jgi:CRP/FNR family transcriptional regulator, cyclic AMP receptor protein